MIELSQRRRFFADEIAAVGAISTPWLVDAIADVPRERFLDPGPWLVRGEADVLTGARRTPDDDPQHVYHNYSIAIDPARHPRARIKAGDVPGPSPVASRRARAGRSVLAPRFDLLSVTPLILP